jgi:hypothetical protein
MGAAISHPQYISDDQGHETAVIYVNKWMTSSPAPQTSEAE